LVGAKVEDVMDNTTDNLTTLRSVIPVERLQFLVDLWEESHWFPPFMDDDDRETKCVKIVEWLSGRRYFVKARRNIRS
jgi:hypothetical protein